MEPDLTVLIVSHNARDDLGRCLASLAAYQGSARFETIVVDNASRDGAADLVRRRFPDVRLIQNPTNRGFAAACNAKPPRGPLAVHGHPSQRGPGRGGPAHGGCLPEAPKRATPPGLSANSAAPTETFSNTGPWCSQR
jgi:GT2 family glycosyltransferase